MRAFVAYGLALLILTGISVQSVAQTRVTGHVFAEVVELTGAESNANKSIEIKAGDSFSDIDLGEISFHGKAGTTYELMVSSSPIKGHDGYEHLFETRCDRHGSTIDVSGNEVIRLTGSADDSLLLSSERQYAGEYQVVFVYN
jgi:hypothetical protein